MPGHGHWSGQLAILGDELAVGDGLEHAKTFRTAGDVDIGKTARSDPAQIARHAIGLSHVERHHLDGICETDAERERQAHQVIEMAVLNESDGVAVVGHQADAARVDLGFRERFDEIGHGRHNRIVAQMSIDAIAHAQQDLFGSKRLMVVVNACGSKDVPDRAFGVGAVAGERLARRARGLDGFEQVRVAESDIERDDLGDADDILPLQSGDNLFGGDVRAAGLQTGERRARARASPDTI